MPDVMLLLLDTCSCCSAPIFRGKNSTNPEKSGTYTYVPANDWFVNSFSVIDEPFLPRSLFSSLLYFPRAFHCVCLNRKRTQSVTAVLKESQGGT
jgi:hypothetical protein